MTNLETLDVDVDLPQETKRDRATGELVVVRPARRYTVRLIIDVEALRQTLCTQAARNRTGKAVLGGGAIMAKVRL